jgi:hypothetical protein
LFTLPVALIIFLFLSPINKDLSPAVNVYIGLFSFILIGLIFYFIAPKALRKLSELSVCIYADRLERIAPENREEFFWKDLLRVEISEYPNGEIILIKLTFVDKQIVNLFGFENMEMAANQIAQYLPVKSLIHRKRTKINWDNPLIMIANIVLPLIFILVIQKMGETTYYFFVALFYSAFGLYFLIASPILHTRGKSWRTLEIIIGTMFIVISIFVLILSSSLR